jgi:hypothetical protein
MEGEINSEVEGRENVLAVCRKVVVAAAAAARRKCESGLQGRKQRRKRMGMKTRRWRSSRSQTIEGKEIKSIDDDDDDDDDDDNGCLLSRTYRLGHKFPQILWHSLYIIFFMYVCIYAE